MARFILAIIAFAMALAVIKAIIIAIVVAGLVFRTRETIALLVLGGLITFVSAYPIAGFALLGVFIVMAIVKASKKSSAEPVAVLEDQPE